MPWRCTMVGTIITFSVIWYIINSCIHNSKVIGSCKIWQKAEHRDIGKTNFTNRNWTDLTCSTPTELYRRQSPSRLCLFFMPTIPILGCGGEAPRWNCGMFSSFKYIFSLSSSGVKKHDCWGMIGIYQRLERRSSSGTSCHPVYPCFAYVTAS